MCKFYSHSFRGGTKIYPLEYELLSDMCDPSFHMNIFPIFVTLPFRDRRGASSQKTPQNHSSYLIRYGFRAGAEAIQYSLHIALVVTFQFFFFGLLEQSFGVTFLRNTSIKGHNKTKKMHWNE